MRLAQVVVEKGLMLESRTLKLMRCEVQELLQYPKRFLFRDKFSGKEVIDLQNETGGFLVELRLGTSDFVLQHHDLLIGREQGKQFSPSAFAVFAFSKKTECFLRMRDFQKYDVVDRE